MAGFESQRRFARNSAAASGLYHSVPIQRKQEFERGVVKDEGITLATSPLNPLSVHG